MQETDRLEGSIGRIDLDFVEREAAPKLFMKIAIQLHLAGLSLANPVLLLEVFGISRDRSTVHNRVHKASLQPKSRKNPDQVAVDETVVRLKMNDTGCTRRSMRIQTICCLRCLNRPETR